MAGAGGSHRKNTDLLPQQFHLLHLLKIKKQHTYLISVCKTGFLHCNGNNGRL